MLPAGLLRWLSCVSKGDTLYSGPGPYTSTIKQEKAPTVVPIGQSDGGIFFLLMLPHPR